MHTTILVQNPMSIRIYTYTQYKSISNTSIITKYNTHIPKLNFYVLPRVEVIPKHTAQRKDEKLHRMSIIGYDIVTEEET